MKNFLSRYGTYWSWCANFKQDILLTPYPMLKSLSKLSILLMILFCLWSQTLTLLTLPMLMNLSNNSSNNWKKMTSFIKLLCFLTKTLILTLYQKLFTFAQFKANLKALTSSAKILQGFWDVLLLMIRKNLINRPENKGYPIRSQQKRWNTLLFLILGPFIPLKKSELSLNNNLKISVIA
jgi:hypothetical protein